MAQPVRTENRMELSAEEQQLVTAPISRKDAVLKLLRNAIIDGRLPAGQRLDQNELAARLGVSRMPVREALKQLEVEKLVVVFPYRGVEVASLDPATIVEMFEIRVALERLAVGRAVECLSAADLKAMRQTLELMDGHLDDAAATAPWMELNHRFHATINSAGGWPHLVETIDQYRGNVERYVRFYLSAGGRARSQEEHWELLAACEKGDVAGAQAVIEKHLRNTATALIDAIRLSEGPAGRHTEIGR
ncbi:GntR family transcriptional regulator [Pseudaminobacter arsenicus]|uniref:GntR family transcriptional regulator n=1 Tax=Borborobacter arsenicus TaxID=1851146 RepID=A0A432V315_9HYPH|nr:GntR family transcriptional regulator [Pseudaminobacter arsenicus]RUM96599.1 GntR family transcriptional regulator [Pseudaminobacter arsenicus]